MCTLCHYVASTVEEPLFCSTYLYAYVLPTTDISTETQLKLFERTKPGQCPKLSFLSFRKQQGAVCCSPTLTSENEAPFLLLLIIQSSLFYKQHLLTHYYSTLCYSLLYSCHITPNPIQIQAQEEHGNSTECECCEVTILTTASLCQVLCLF